jgi:uncharacterized protein (DUF2267 family)
MSTDRFTLFQETLQRSAGWIHELSAVSGLDDEQQVYHVLTATLQTLRDRLPVDEAVQLGAQLPVLIRGLYYEGWRPSEAPMRLRHRHEFVAKIASRYHAKPLEDLEAAVRAAFVVLGRHVSIGEAVSVVRALPEELRTLWPGHIVGAA